MTKGAVDQRECYSNLPIGRLNVLKLIVAPDFDETGQRATRAADPGADTA
jgi:hypothetical protein